MKKHLSRIVFFLLVFVLSLYLLSFLATYKSMEQLKPYLPQELIDPFSQARGGIDKNKLLETNSDYLGWLTIEGTNINYPVVAGKKYLRKDFYGKYSLSGTPFIQDYNEDRMIFTIFGHNMGFGRKDFFQNVLLYEDKDFYDKHPDVYFTEKNRRGNKYKVVGYMEYHMKDLPKFNFNRTKFMDSKDFHEWQEGIAKRATHLDPNFMEINYGTGRFLILSTCHSPSWWEDSIRSVLICYQPNRLNGANLDYFNIE